MIEYDEDNRITYEEEADCLYIWKAPPQGRLGAVMLYCDKENQAMVSLDTDEVGTIVGIEINNLHKICKDFKLKKNRN